MCVCTPTSIARKAFKRIRSSNDPNRTGRDPGWNLFIVLLGTAPPSQELEPLAIPERANRRVGNKFRLPVSPEVVSRTAGMLTSSLSGENPGVGKLMWRKRNAAPTAALAFGLLTASLVSVALDPTIDTAASVASVAILGAGRVTIVTNFSADGSESPHRAYIFRV
ncbi:hypothetical protein ABIB07_003989 [Bradyrhizobium sp. RT10b]